jgi:hypothetical protein
MDASDNIRLDMITADMHLYWSTHCRHRNHTDCKGRCKICESPCLCDCHRDE